MEALIPLGSISALDVAIVIAIVLIVRWAFVYAVVRVGVDGMPGPIPLPVVGSSLRLLHSLRVLHHFGPEWHRLSPLLRIWLANTPSISVADPELLQRILISKQKIYDRSRLEQYATKRLLAGGLLMSDNGAAWKRARDLLTPAFHRQRLRSLTPLIARRTCCLVDKLQRQQQDQTTHDQGPGRLAFFDMELEFQKLTFDVIGIIALGVDFRSQELEESVYERAWHHILEHLMLSFCVPLPVWAWKCLTFIPSVKRFEEAMSLMDSMVYGTIKQRSSEPIDENDQSILAHMLRVRNSDQDAMQWLTNEQIRNELITLLFAGHDTTTSLVTWALYYISQDPAVLADIRKEIDELLPESIFDANSSTAASIEHELIAFDCTRLKHLRSALAETLRLKPGAPVRGRTLIEPDELGGYQLAAGTDLAWTVWTVHRLPQYWPNPEKFDPTRFYHTTTASGAAGEVDPTATKLSHDNELHGTTTTATSAKQHPMAYAPFGGGVRRCIGEHMALNEATIILAMLLKRFEFSVVPGIEITDEWTLTLRTKNGMPMYCHARE